MTQRPETPEKNSPPLPIPKKAFLKLMQQKGLSRREATKAWLLKEKLRLKNRPMPPSAVEVSNRIRTGGGPLLTLLAGETELSCRQEPGGHVAVFSEFAN